MLEEAGGFWNAPAKGRGNATIPRHRPLILCCELTHFVVAPLWAEQVMMVLRYHCDDVSSKLMVCHRRSSGFHP
jgi:hypothetical protein